MNPILVAGEINVDLVLSGCARMPQPDTEILADSFHQVLGSSSMICAMGLARLGEQVIFAGHAGADAHGTFCLDTLRGAGIDVGPVRVRPELKTGVTVALSTATDRALVTFAGSIDALEERDVGDGLLARARHLHVSAYFLQRRLRPGLLQLFTRARALGLTTSLDPGFDPEEQWSGDWPALLRQVDVFLPNEREACAIARTANATAALRGLANGATRTVIKRARDGSATLDDNGEVLSVPARAPASVRDSTGAGDSFDAGFLHAWLAGQPLAVCLAWGNACGSLSTRGIGGTACQPDAQEAQAWLEASP